MTAATVSLFTRALRRHWPLLMLLAVAAGLRLVGWLAIHPAWWILGDSIGYIDDALKLHPQRWRPSGYSLMVLWPLLPLHRLAAVTLVQQAMGLAVGVLVYVTVLRLRLPRWTALLAAAPVLLDATTIASGQMLASEPLFELAVVVAVALLLWSAGSPGGRLPLAAAGVALGVAAITRTVGLPLIGVAVVALLVRRPGWLRPVALCLGFAVPVGLYSLWFDSAYGQLNLTASTGIYMYGHVSKFTDCSRVRFSDESLRRLCPTGPAGQRSEIYYVFDASSPLGQANLGDVGGNTAAGRFALDVIRSQPGDYAADTWGLIVTTFSWDRSSQPDDVRFRLPEPMNDSARVAGTEYQQGRDPGPTYRPTLVRALATYQGAIWFPGTLYLLGLLIGLASLLFGRDPDRSGLRSAVLLTAGSSAAMLMLPALTTIIGPRYLVPVTPILCISIATSEALLVNRWREARHGAMDRRVPERSLPESTRL
jgi:hypothetical protein